MSSTLPRRAPSRQLNVRLLVVTLLAAVVAVPALYIWHQRQLQLVTAALFERASALEADGDDANAIHYLYRCLQLSDDDEQRRDLTVRLARSYDRAQRNGNPSTVIDWYYRAIGLAPDDPSLQLRLAELFLETRQYRLADEQSRKLLDQNLEVAAAQRVSALARFGQLRNGYPADVTDLLNSLQDTQRRSPGDVDVAEALAYLYRVAPPPGLAFDPTQRADAVMDVLVRNASDNFRAYLARHRYRTDYLGVDDDRDLRKALQLAPDNPECLLAAAEYLQQTGNWREAGDAFAKLVDVRPADYRGYLGVGESHYRLQKRNEAFSVWREGLRKVSQGRLALQVRLADALIEDGQQDVARRQLDELEEAIGRLATTEGEAQRAWVMTSRDLLLAKWHMADGNYREAVALLQRAATTGKSQVSQQPESAPAFQGWLLLGQCYQRLQQWENAANSFQQALQLVPRSLAARLWAAQAWAAVGRDDQAILLCEQAAARPNAPEDVWLMLAQLHLRYQLRRLPSQRDWRRLDQVLDQAEQALPDNWELPLVRANLALTRSENNGVSQAMQILLAEEHAHPHSVPMWSNLVFMYQRMGMPADADRALHRLAEENANVAQTNAWRVALLGSRGDYSAAQAVLDDPAGWPTAVPDADMWQDRARMFLAYQKGDLAQIRSALLAAHARRPQATHLLIQLADLAVVEANWVEADRWLAKLKVAEGHDGVWWRFFLAQRLLATDNAEAQVISPRVIALYDEVRRLRPWWPGVSMLQALMAETQGRVDEASDAYASAIRAGFQQPHVYQRLVRTLYQQGRFEEADNWLAQLQQQAPLDVKVLDLAWSAAVQRNQLELALRIARQNLAQ
ncbi:MAG: tetratricopeptide repeat protein, partial [Planctomycetales bacterium]|nr:tetratricopeptide repeat protein [Planctomycetales bacterium]